MKNKMKLKGKWKKYEIITDVDYTKEKLKHSFEEDRKIKVKSDKDKGCWKDNAGRRPRKDEKDKGKGRENIERRWRRYIWKDRGKGKKRRNVEEDNIL